MGDNTALLFVKPHAFTPATIEYCRKRITEEGLTILEEKECSDLGAAVDRHYHAIASKAVMPPKELSVPNEAFQKTFGVSWQSVLDAGHVVTATEVMSTLSLDAAGMEDTWRRIKKEGNLVKLGGGFYAGKVRSDPPLYCFNGFYMSMRDKYANAASKIHVFVVNWSSEKKPWEKFRDDFLGPTDPKAAPADSLRGYVLGNWQALGLKAEPDVGDNCVHGSASPFEAWVEIQNWVKQAPDASSFGKAIASTVDSKKLEAWSYDPKVTYGHKEFPVSNSLFDAFENMDSGDVLALAHAINATQV
jgi:nucleoside diphosphate kinase